MHIQKLENLIKAIEYLNKALKLNPDFFEAQYGISECIFSSCQIMIKHFKNLNNAIKIKPDYMTALKSKVVLLRLMNKNKDALKFLEKVIKHKF